MTCEFCGISLKGSRKKTVEHINISQPHQTHHFCSLSCKDRWCLQLQRYKARLIVIWSIGSYAGRYFFVKKLMKVRSPSLLSLATNRSYFKPKLQEIELLQLVNLHDRKVLKVRD
ncbi:MAG: hypothetical protein EAX91_01945 [Candidatus Lokiarchaeota archaeon]|nr:hypothetical protein [Candidatus Lokiarchaeota archaeon]